MADLISIDDELATRETYQKYTQQQAGKLNDRIEKDGNIFDALLSEEADFTNTPYGNEIISAIRNYDGSIKEHEENGI